MKIFVANVPFHFDDKAVGELFGVFGQVLDARIICSATTRESKGFGFVEMPVESQALRAIGTLNGTLIEGRRMFVQLAKQHTHH